MRAQTLDQMCVIPDLIFSLDFAWVVFQFLFCVALIYLGLNLGFIVCDLVNVCITGGFIRSDTRPENKYQGIIRYLPVPCIFCDGYIEKLYKRTFFGIMGYRGNEPCKKCKSNVH